jgi:glycosyltransferase involved in cell wall biosynthesis
MTEVGYGWKVPGTKELNPLYSFGTRVNEDALYAALEEAYKLRGTETMKIMGEEARKHAQRYDWDVVVKDYMLPELESWYLDRRL